MEKQWIRINAEPTPRGGAAAAVVDDRLFVFGGGLSPYKFVETAEFFDSDAGCWKAIAPMAVARNNAVAAVVGNEIYVIAGLVHVAGCENEEKPASEPCSTVEAYNVKTGTWSKKADLPFARVKPAVGVVNGKIYAIGGRHGDSTTDSIAEYDPATDTWEEKGTFPIALKHASACVYRDKIYVTGGWSPEQVEGQPKPGKFHTDVFVFDPQSGSCTKLADMPISRAGHAVVELGGMLYVFGGVKEDRSVVMEVHQYDVANDAWSTVAELDSPRAVFEARVLGEAVYLAGGWKQLHGRSPNPEFVMFVPSVGMTV